MTAIDVNDLKREDLPAGKFPADPRAPFRLHLSPEVRRGIESHAKADDAVEICGVLVGYWQRDEHGPFATVTDYIRCDSASSKYAEVTFTHESWAEINKEMDTRYADKRIVGWYHSHPDFGIFLSDRDSFIHEHFFSGAGQVAYVIDPVRDLEGVFTWQKGKPTPMAHFWIGDQICTVEASQRNPARDAAALAPRDSGRVTASTALADARPAERSSLPTAMTMLAWLALFLLGYMYAAWRTRWEQERIIEGAVAHYGVNKFMKLGLEQDLVQVRKVLRSIENEIGKLPKATATLSAEDAAKADKQRQLIRDSLLITEQALGEIQTKYTFSKEEMAILAQIVAEKHAELLAPRPTSPKPVNATPSPTKTPSSESAPAKQPDKPKPPAASPDKESEKSAPEGAAKPTPPPVQPSGTP